jgi:hypothetical protein
VYHEPEPQQQPGGCLEVLVLTRAMFGILFWPVLALVGTMLAVVMIFFLFTVHPALALIPVAAIALAVYIFARWEQRHFRPPGMGPP